MNPNRRPTYLPDQLEAKRSQLASLQASVVMLRICRYYGVRMKVIKTRKRDGQTAEARLVALYFMTVNMSLSLGYIGMACLRDHTTAIYARDTIEELIKVDSVFRRRIIRIGFKLINQQHENTDNRTSNGAAA
jgi:chromosomal replication initiation ATPase DnaA